VRACWWMTTMGSAERHEPCRPSWDCADCGEPWPCPSRRTALLREFLPERVGLLMFMSRLMLDAIDDFFTQGTGQVAGMHERFLGWVPWVEPANSAENGRPDHRCGTGRTAA
jgi:hypothetical protein